MNTALNGVSILVCTFNGKNRLGPTLQHLAAQKSMEGFGVEVLVIDNGSTDGTEQFALAKWKEFNAAMPLQVIRENRPGKTHATETGFKASQYDVIIICDDDNWLCEDYVSRAYSIMQSDNMIGAIGGRGIAVFEAHEPEWFNRHAGLFAVGAQGTGSGDVTDTAYFLWGAGMVVRKSAWITLLNMHYEFILNYDGSKKGNYGGEDVELLEMIRMAGYKIWYSDEMTFKHFMPADRMTYQYLKNKFYGAGRIRVCLHAFIHYRTSNLVPGKNLKYPMWLDKWQYKVRAYLKEWPRFVFASKTEVDDNYLRFLAQKGEVDELWQLKNEYSAMYEKILAAKQQLAIIKQGGK